MTNKEFLNQLALKLMGSEARIKELEQQIAQLTMSLNRSQAELRATALDKLAELDADLIDSEAKKD